MYVKLTLGERLKDLRTERGLTLEQLAQETGISKSALGNYEGDEQRDISPLSIVTLAQFYEVPTDYLLGVIETKKYPASEQVALGLDDGAMEVLAGTRMNKRLLSELLKHPAFPHLMVDMEIYVDRIASMQIQHINNYVDTARKQIEATHAPQSPDLYVEALKVAHVDEHEYFTKSIYEHLAVILKGIQKDHETDTTTADTDSIVEQMQATVNEALTMPESEVEQRVHLTCKMYGINPDEVPEEEKLILASFMNRIPKNMRTSMKELERSSKRGARQVPRHGKGKRKRR